MSETSNCGDIGIVLSTEQVQKRVRELACQITADFQGRTIHAVCVLKNGFVFMADLVRALDSDTVCHFVHSDCREITQGANTATQVFFSPEPDVRGAHVLVVEALVESGVTSEFLVRSLLGRGAASVKLVALLDRPSARRVALQPDYFGFLVDAAYLFGYGLGAPELGRNLPYVAAGSPAHAGAVQQGA